MKGEDMQQNNLTSPHDQRYPTFPHQSSTHSSMLKTRWWWSWPSVCLLHSCTVSKRVTKLTTC